MKIVELLRGSVIYEDGTQMSPFASQFVRP
jgi:hypothetical protein